MYLLPGGGDWRGGFHPVFSSLSTQEHCLIWQHHRLRLYRGLGDDAADTGLIARGIPRADIERHAALTPWRAFRYRIDGSDAGVGRINTTDTTLIERVQFPAGTVPGAISFDGTRVWATGLNTASVSAF